MSTPTSLIKFVIDQSQPINLNQTNVTTRQKIKQLYTKHWIKQCHTQTMKSRRKKREKKKLNMYVNHLLKRFISLQLPPKKKKLMWSS